MSDDPRDPRDPRNEGDDESQSVAPFDSGASVPPEDAARWSRPEQALEPPKQVERPRRSKRPVNSEDRFPMLPDEAPPPTAPLKDPPKQRPPVKRKNNSSSDLGRNLVSLFFLLASCGVIAYIAILWQNPYSTLNPLAPPTPLPVVITATYTPSATFTASPTLTPTLTLTPTAIPTLAPTLTFTPIFLEGFSTPQGTPPPTDDTNVYQFGLQRDHVLYITNPDARGGCNWSSIAGSVMNYDGSALNGYGVHVVGDGVDQTVATGSAPGFGPGGFEVPLGNVARDAQYIAQLIDPQGTPVSPVYTVVTRSDCDFNIAALRFVENLPSS
ncbi:MAG: hypothetical protein GC204_13415 [Chloroflexi bacterium]|nr:hypothetical protein [Chloroflexota bacterium]